MFDKISLYFGLFKLYHLGLQLETYLILAMEPFVELYSTKYFV